MVVIFSAVPENSRYLQPIRNKTSPIPTRCAALSCASKKFSTECQRQSDIALSLLFFALTRFVKLRPGLASLTPPMRFKTKINQDLVARVFVLTLSSDWLFKVSSFLLIGCRYYFGFGLTTRNRKALHYSLLL